MKLQVHQARNKQWFVRLVGRNGRVVFATETYTRKTDAARIAHRIRVLMVDPLLTVDIAQ